MKYLFWRTKSRDKFIQVPSSNVNYTTSNVTSMDGNTVNMSSTTVQEFQKLLEDFNSLKQQLTQFPIKNSRPEPNTLDDIQSQFKF